MLSFWEKQSFINYDYIVVGGGIVGLSTAASLSERFPKSSILVLERGIFPSGASTKNAGFACFGSLTELLADLKKMTEQECLDLVFERKQGLLQLRKRLGDCAIDYCQFGGYELLSEQELYALESIDYVNHLLKDLFLKDVFSLKNDLIDTFGFAKTHTKALIFNRFDAQIDTGKMMKTLQSFVQERKITVLTGCAVSHIEENSKNVLVYVENPVFPSQRIGFEASQVALCTNAFSKTFLPDADITPGRGQVIITEPVENLKFRGTFHFDEGYYYFRDFYGRLLFGGGRNLDETAEATTEFALTDKIMDNLTQKIKDIILPNQEFKIAHQWSGIMAFGKTKAPIIRRHSERIVVGVRMGGMGVAIGTRAGEKIAQLF